MTLRKRFSTLREAVRQAKQEDTVAIYLNRSVNTATGLKTPHGQSRPDITFVKKDGTIHQRETPSKTDSHDLLRERMDRATEGLPESMRGKNKLIDNKGLKK